MIALLRYALVAFLLLSFGPVHAEMVIGPGDPGRDRTLLIHGTTDLEAFRMLVEGFARAHPGIRIEYDERSTLELYNEATTDCANGTARADLLISSAMDLQVELVNNLCAQAHNSPQVQALPDWAEWRHEVVGLTLEPAVLIYNRRLISPDDVPRTRFELIDLLREQPRLFANRVATYDVANSGIGYLFASADARNTTAFGRLIEAMGRLGVRLECCAAPMIDGVISGKYALAYNVLGSYAAQAAVRNPHLGIVLFDDYSIATTRAALIPRYAENSVLAGQFIDFALSLPGREALRQAHLLPDPQVAESDLRPIALSPRLLAGLDRLKRQNFIDRFTAAVSPSRLRPDLRLMPRRSMRP
jgi:ABC-type Fe3+ transport system substrate-binding protein